MGKVKVDASLCVGCRSCVENFGELFEFDENENISKVKEGVDYEKLGLDKEAIKGVCPAGAISVE